MENVLSMLQVIINEFNLDSHHISNEKQSLVRTCHIINIDFGKQKKGYENTTNEILNLFFSLSPSPFYFISLSLFFSLHLSFSRFPTNFLFLFFPLILFLFLFLFLSHSLSPFHFTHSLSLFLTLSLFVPLSLLKFPGIGHESRQRSWLRLWKMPISVYGTWRKSADAELSGKHPEVR